MQAPALLDDADGGWISYGELGRLSGDWADRLAGPRSLVFLYAGNDIISVAAMLGAIAAGHALALFDPHLRAISREALEAIYRPEWVIDPGAQEPLRPGASPADSEPLHPDLALLLSTSGSTGSPKLVRLSWPAVEANARGIADVLHIRPDDVAAGYLPLHYSYGLSVLTSHLVRGARIRLTGHGITDRAFWGAMRDARVTHMPGVPFHLQTMLKLGLKRLGLSGLRTLTQAGGHLDVGLRRQAHEHMDSIGGGFFVLYGQTEASPRMTTLQHGDFLEAPASVGVPLPDCRIEIVEPDRDHVGEVVFHGPNVMMGYAEARADLSRGDELSSRLHSGDVGFLDAGGRLTITGRVKRVAKLFGLRVNLDEVETLLNAVCEVAVVQEGEALAIHFAAGEAGEEEVRDRLLDRLRQRLTVPPGCYRMRPLSAIPRTERGKVDYSVLGKDDA